LLFYNWKLFQYNWIEPILIVHDKNDKQNIFLGPYLFVKAVIGLRFFFTVGIEKQNGIYIKSNLYTISSVLYSTVCGIFPVTMTTLCCKH